MRRVSTTNSLRTDRKGFLRCSPVSPGTFGDGRVCTRLTFPCVTSAYSGYAYKETLPPCEAPRDLFAVLLSILSASRTYRSALLDESSPSTRSRTVSFTKSALVAAPRALTVDRTLGSRTLVRAAPELLDNSGVRVCLPVFDRARFAVNRRSAECACARPIPTDQNNQSARSFSNIVALAKLQNKFARKLTNDARSSLHKPCLKRTCVAGFRVLFSTTIFI